MASISSHFEIFWKGPVSITGSLDVVSPSQDIPLKSTDLANTQLCSENPLTTVPSLMFPRLTGRSACPAGAGTLGDSLRSLPTRRVQGKDKPHTEATPCLSSCKDAILLRTRRSQQRGAPILEPPGR